LRYRATRILGQGGFGRTFLAVDEDKPSQPPCVIKQFYPQAQGTDNIEKATQLFAREAEQLERLGRHPQISELLAYFTEGGKQYLIQEYIDGQDLGKILETEGKFTAKQIRNVLEQILPVLDYLHQHQVVHRDIKPENLIRRADGKLILVDFGAAKYLSNAALSVTGTTIGSAGYASPEQVLGKPQPNSDIYSLGATCVCLLTQIEPFDLFDVTVNKWVWRDYLETPVEEPLAKILDKMLVVATKRRYQSASEILQDLQPIASQSPAPKQHFSSPTSSPQTEQQSLASPVASHSTFKDKLRSAVGYDYTQLRDLLANGKWKEADEETANAILKVSGRENEGWLRLEDVEKIPGEDLQTIDRLWIHYSNGHFGFSIQKQIYQSLKNHEASDAEGWEKLGDTVGWLVQKNAPQLKEVYQNLGSIYTGELELWETFGDAVGWRKYGKWKQYGKLHFALDGNSPRGHLPVGDIQIMHYAKKQQWPGISIPSVIPLPAKWRKRVEFLEHLSIPKMPSSPPATPVESPPPDPKSTSTSSCQPTSSQKPSTAKTIFNVKQRSLSAVSSLSKILPISKSNPAPIELRSAVGYDYTRLQNLLATGKWQEADKETAYAMLKVARRKQEEWLYPEDIKKFPCKDLQTIDRLWTNYSNGHFGFSIQQQIYQSLGGTEAKNVKIWEKFGDAVTRLMQGKLPKRKQIERKLDSTNAVEVRVWEEFGEAVGWRENGEWKNYSNFCFVELESTPQGHLPLGDLQIIHYAGSEEGLVWCYILLWELKATLFGRTEICR
jgi:serine/threonine protein kinase